MEGRKVLGEISEAEVFPPFENPSEITVEQWTSSPLKRNLKMLNMVTSSGDVELDKAANVKTEKEVTGGYAKRRKISEVNLSRVCITPRFPKWELKDTGEWAARNISDWKVSEGNKTVHMKRKYTPEDLATAHALIRVLKGTFGQQTPLSGFRADYSMAFRQNPTHPDQADITMEAYYDVTDGPTLLETYGQPFGGKGSQFNYIRDPEAMCAIARTWLAMLMSHYSNDAWNIGTQTTAEQAYHLWLELNQLIGWK